MRSELRNLLMGDLLLGDLSELGLAFSCLSVDSGFRRKYEPNTASNYLAVDTWSTTYHGPTRPSVDVNEIGLRHVAEPGVTFRHGVSCWTVNTCSGHHVGAQYGIQLLSVDTGPATI